MSEYTGTVGSRKSPVKAWEADTEYTSAWHSNVGAYPKLYGNLRVVRTSENPCIDCLGPHQQSNWSSVSPAEPL